jgi:hypothetical protein
MDTKEVPIERIEVPCSFGHGTAIARFSMPKGCVARPQDREQDLYLQHIAKAEPIGEMDLIKIYQPEVLERFNHDRNSRG